MPIMVGYSDKAATYASAEQMFLSHVVHTLSPWYARVENSADVHLLTKKERASGLYFKFMAAGLLRGAAKDRAEYYAKALGAGGSPAWMAPDEVRALEELNPFGGDAAKLPVATNVPATTPAAA
jgi:phage portal protein BeeE